MTEQTGEQPRGAVWGGTLNLRKQVEPLFENRPSGFLSAEACTRGGAAIHLGLALAQANLRASTSTAGPWSL